MQAETSVELVTRFVAAGVVVRPLGHCKSPFGFFGATITLQSSFLSGVMRQAAI